MDSTGDGTTGARSGALGKGNDRSPSKNWRTEQSPITAHVCGGVGATERSGVTKRVS